MKELQIQTKLNAFYILRYHFVSPGSSNLTAIGAQVSTSATAQCKGLRPSSQGELTLHLPVWSENVSQKTFPEKNLHQLVR